MTDPILEKWADVLLGYCFGGVDFAKAWKNGQKRLWMRYEPPADDLVKIITEKVFEKGGNVFIEQIPSWFEYTFYSKASAEVLFARPEWELKQLDHVAARLMISSTSNTKSLATIDPARRFARRKALTPFIERAWKYNEGDFLIPWCATLYPTPAFAQDSGMPFEEFRDYAYDAMLLNEEDPIKAWEAVAEKQEKLEKEVLDSARTVRIVDKEDETDLVMSVEGHRWFNSNGKRGLPSAEIFNAPRKNSVNGVVTFPRLSQSYRFGPEVRGIRFVFKDGKLVEWKAKVGQDYLDTFFEEHPDARYLGEISLGCHPKLQKTSKNIMYDETIGGTIHIAFGRAYSLHVPPDGDRSQLNKSAVHWDMIRDMRVPTASVLINDKYELKWDAETGRWLVQKLRAH
jgi:aminopeptidase